MTDPRLDGEDEASGKGTNPSGGPSPLPLPWLVGLVALLFLATALPVFIPAPHTGGDNAGYITLAVSLLERGSYQELWDPAEPPHTKYPPGLPLLLAGAILLGARSWVALKALSVLAVTGAVVLAFLWARRRLGTSGALGVALILALSEAFLWASTWILSEPLFLVLTLGALMALDRCSPGVEGGEPLSRSPPLRTACAVALTLGAWATRTAGLPLALALVVWLLWRGARLQALAAATALALPAAAWGLRGAASREVGYLSEFWMRDPYRPDLGTVGMGGLLERALENLVDYGTAHIPHGLVPVEGAWAAFLGSTLLLLAAVGWARSVRHGPGPAELFVPLYGGVILLWPSVWSGDRFALPLYPFLLVYAALALGALGGRGGAAVRRWTLTGAVVVLAVPAALGWWKRIPESAACRSLVASQGPFACYALPVQEWAEAARWSGSFLPEDAVVFSRKPRLLYVLSGGIRSLTYPFSDDPETFFTQAEASGIQYVLVDRLDNLAPFYLVPVITQAPERFCAVAGWGQPGSVRTELLGILPPGEGGGGEATEGEGEAATVVIPRCGPEYVADAPRPEIPYASSLIPLLVRAR